MEAGKQLEDTWKVFTQDSVRHDVWVPGLNRYHRGFTGDLAAQPVKDAVRPEVRVCDDIANGNVCLTMMNRGQGDAHFVVREGLSR